MIHKHQQNQTDADAADDRQRDQTSKYFDKIAWTAMILILGITILFMNGGDLGLQAMAHTMGYETRLFDRGHIFCEEFPGFYFRIMVCAVQHDHIGMGV